MRIALAVIGLTMIVSAALSYDAHSAAAVCPGRAPSANPIQDYWYKGGQTLLGIRSYVLNVPVNVYNDGVASPFTFSYSYVMLTGYGRDDIFAQIGPAKRDNDGQRIIMAQWMYPAGQLQFNIIGPNPKPIGSTTKFTIVKTSNIFTFVIDDVTSFTAPSAFLPDEIIVSGEISNKASQIPGTISSHEYFMYTNFQDFWGSWFPFNSSTAYTQDVSVSDHLIVNAHRFEIWDKGCP